MKITLNTIAAAFRSTRMDLQQRPNLKRALLLAVGCLIVGLVGVGSWLLAGPHQEARLSRTEFQSYARARSFYKARKFDSARGQLAGLMGTGAQYFPPQILAARIEFYTRNFSGAEKILRQILKQDPRHTQAAMWLGKTLLVSPGRHQEAARIFSAVLRTDPESYMARYYLGRALERNKAFRGALVQYQHALAVEHQLSKIHLHMARLFQNLKLPDRARKHATRVRSLSVSARDRQAATTLLSTLK